MPFPRLNSQASSPSFLRRVSGAAAFALGGVIACGSGLALFESSHESSQKALAQALEAQNRAAVQPAAPAAPAAPSGRPTASTILTQKVTETVLTPKVAKAEVVISCPINGTEAADSICSAGAAAKPVAAVTNQPAAATRRTVPAAEVPAPAVVASKPAKMSPPAPAAPFNPLEPPEATVKQSAVAPPVKQAEPPAKQSTAEPPVHESRAEVLPTETPAPVVAPAPTPPKKTVRSQNSRGYSYERSHYRYNNHRQNFFFPFFR